MTSRNGLVVCSVLVAVVLGSAACASRNDENAADSLVEQVVAASPYGVTVYRESDRCEGGETVVVEVATDCNAFRETDLARSVKVRGKCIAVAGRSVRFACMRHKQGATVVFSSDTCSDDSLIASVVVADNCASYSDVERSRGMITTGPCLGCDECAKAIGATPRQTCEALLWAGGP